jgi:Fungal Zn(2)-Cys(6) binuclear cluster domain
MPPKPNHGPSAAETNGPELQETAKPEEDVPACQLCRKKKARCNRAQPCAQCIRFNVPCVYDDRHMKPGLRAGAVDQLCRRIETLESMFLGQEMIWQQMWHVLCPNTSLPESLKRPSTSPDLEARREQLKSSLLLAGSSLEHSKSQRELEKDSSDMESVERPAKRHRLYDVNSPSFLVNSNSDSSGILPTEIMNELVDFYHVNIHPWIPILHVAKFRERMKLAHERPRITCILHAIIAVCIRFSRNDHLQDEETKSQIAEKSRQKVILNSTESFSVENLQALVIIAFETVSNKPALLI